MFGPEIISYKLHNRYVYATHPSPCPNLCNELDDTSSLFDLLLSELGYESGFNDEWSVETSFTEL